MEDEEMEVDVGEDAEEQDIEHDLFDHTPVKNDTPGSVSPSPSRSLKRVKCEEPDSEEEEDDEADAPPSPRVKHKREYAEQAKKKIIKQEPRSDDPKDNKIEGQDSREGSCERSDCPVQKTCCLSMATGCLMTCVDVVGKLFHHITKSEHICQVCYDTLWKPGFRYGGKFAIWKSAWTEESRCNPSVKGFVLDQILPYWIECTQCNRFRKHESEEVISSDCIKNYMCKSCEDPEDISVPDAREPLWIMSIAASPLMQNSPCLHYLRGGHYFYDELGLSPVECQYEATQCASSEFMFPFNIPDQQSKAFCLRPDIMEYDEVVAFPEYSLEPIVYLALRNLIVTLWNLNPFQYLTVEDCIPHLICRGLARVWYIQELNRTHEYLRVKSIINYGVLEIPKNPRLKGSQSPLDVVIVGAGVSGLAAARQLRAFGANVKVLEAKPHFGGRMKDDWSLGVAVGCGAQLVTGSLNNPIILMCEQVGVDYRIVEGPCPMIDGELGKVVETKVDRFVEEHLDCVLDALYHWKNSTKNNDASLEGQFTRGPRWWLITGSILFDLWFGVLDLRESNTPPDIDNWNRLIGSK